MEMYSDATDPWLMTIGLLSADTHRAHKPAPTCKPRSMSRHDKPVDGLTVRVLERATATRVTLAWRDPSRCSYGDQEWYLTSARRSGVCAISGLQIRRGESVYRPRMTRPPALNAEAMIRAEALDSGAATIRVAQS
jgi:hypothetical protein